MTSKDDKSLNIDSFWEHLVPQSHYRKLNQVTPEKLVSRALNLRLKNWRSVSDTQKKELIKRVEAVDDLIINSLLEEPYNETASKDGHRDVILKQLGLK